MKSVNAVKEKKKIMKTFKAFQKIQQQRVTKLMFKYFSLSFKYVLFRQYFVEKIQQNLKVQ